jgi:hypothetical protein
LGEAQPYQEAKNRYHSVSETYDGIFRVNSRLKKSFMKNNTLKRVSMEETNITELLGEHEKYPKIRD